MELSREEIISVIEGKGNASRIPMLYQMWVYPDIFKDKKNEIETIIKNFPMDVERIFINMPDVYNAPDDEPSYRWLASNISVNTSVGLDARVGIEDWSELDDILADFPSFNSKYLFPQTNEPTGKYRLLHWWYWLFERLWSLRGMENALTDFYYHPQEVHRLFEALTDFYCGILTRAKAELKVDGVLISDDIGTQSGPFFSMKIFREFFKPYYNRLIKKAHELNMHVWLHSCGNIELFLPEFIEIGLDVVHPIQRHTMDEAQIAKKFGDKICILAGFDVQQSIPYGTEEEVRKEVRYLIDTFARSDGRFMLTMGNGITADCPPKSLSAVMDETLSYGKEKINTLRR